MAVRLVLVDLDGDRFGFVRVTMVMLAIRSVNMRCRGRGCDGISGWMRVIMAMTVPP